MRYLHSIVLCVFCLTTEALEAATVAGGVAGTLTVKNSIIYNDITYPQIAATVTISNSAVRGSTVPAGSGNLLVNSYSAFKDAVVAPVDTFSYYLSPTSTLTDVGNTTVPSNMPTKDLNGNDRVYNGIIDIGAVEYSEIHQNGTGAWGTAIGWNIGRIPTTDDIVTIRSATTVSTTDAVCKSIIAIEAGASLTISPAMQLNVSTNISNTSADRLIVKASNSLANGSLIFHNAPSSPVYATVEMYSKANKGTPVTYNGNTYTYNWQYFGIPINIVTASPTFDGSYVRKWVESGDSITNHWVSVNNTFQLQPFYGYELTQQAAKTIYFQGPLVNWDWTSPQLTKTSTALFPGQHVLANPFTAAIDIKKIVFRSDMESSVYLYSTGSFGDWNSQSSFGSNPGQYVVSTPGTAGNLGVESQVPSMQAMLVQVNNATANATVTIPYSAAVKNTAQQRVKEINDSAISNNVSLRIDIAGSRSSDKMWLFTEPTCTRNFDNGWDGTKMLGSALSPQLYAIESDGEYQIDCLDDMNNTQLGFQAGEDTEYTMTFTQNNLKSKYAGVYLVDQLAKKTIDITESGSGYSFTAISAPSATKRFKIVAINAKDSPAETSSKIKLFSDIGTIFIQNSSDLNGNILIFDIAGHYLEKRPFTPNGITTVSGFVPGIYIAKAVTKSEEVTKKMIVR